MIKPCWNKMHSWKKRKDLNSKETNQKVVRTITQNISLSTEENIHFVTTYKQEVGSKLDLKS